MRAFACAAAAAAARPTTPPETAPAGRVRVAMAIDLEAANRELIELWLAAAGLPVQWRAGSEGPLDLILIEIAFPRREDRQRNDGLSRAWPGVPVVVLSPTFFPDVPGQGRLARELGATAVLAMPLQRERVVAVARELLGALP